MSEYKKEKTQYLTQRTNASKKAMIKARHPAFINFSNARKLLWDSFVKLVYDNGGRIGNKPRGLSIE